MPKDLSKIPTVVVSRWWHAELSSMTDCLISTIKKKKTYFYIPKNYNYRGRSQDSQDVGGHIVHLFPKHHQDYIYKWNNYHRAPPEHWQRTLKTWKDRKVPCVMEYDERKKEGKGRGEEVGWDLCHCPCGTRSGSRLMITSVLRHDFCGSILVALMKTKSKSHQGQLLA